MQLRQAAIVHDSDLRIRYGPALTPDAYMLDLYELTTYRLQLRAIPAPLHCLQSSVLLPLWQTFGYTSEPFRSEGQLLPLPALQRMYPQQSHNFMVNKAYAILLQICCSPFCDFLVQADVISPHPTSHSLLSPLHSSPVPVPSSCPRNLPAMLEVDSIIGFNTLPAPRTRSGCFYQVAWCPSLAPNPIFSRALARVVCIQFPLQLPLLRFQALNAFIGQLGQAQSDQCSVLVLKCCIVLHSTALEAITRHVGPRRRSRRCQSACLILRRCSCLLGLSIHMFLHRIHLLKQTNSKRLWRALQRLK